MKILIVATTISPDSGAGRYTKSVLDEYEKRGILYKVICIPMQTTIGSFFSHTWLILRESKDCDIVHVFDGWPYAVYAKLASIIRPRPLFINAVGTYSVRSFKSKWKGFFLANAYKGAVKMYAISKFIRDRIGKYVHLDNMDVVYLGTTEIPKPSEAKIDEIKKRYGITNQSPLLLTVGGIKDRKGQFETVEAVKILKEKYPDILYCIVGITTGNKRYAEKIEKYISENSLENNVKIIIDAATDEDLSCFYSLCDIFLLNSKFDEESEHAEGFGLVLLEAAQFGKPVIGSKGSGIPEAMDEGYNGYLIDEIVPDKIADAVEKALLKKGELGAHSIEVAQRYSWKKTADAYIEGYKLIK